MSAAEAEFTEVDVADAIRLSLSVSLTELGQIVQAFWGSDRPVPPVGHQLTAMYEQTEAQVRGEIRRQVEAQLGGG